MFANEVKLESPETRTQTKKGELTITQVQSSYNNSIVNASEFWVTRTMTWWREKHNSCRVFLNNPNPRIKPTQKMNEN